MGIWHLHLAALDQSDQVGSTDLALLIWVGLGLWSVVMMRRIYHIQCLVFPGIGDYMTAFVLLHTWTGYVVALTDTYADIIHVYLC
jgi:hypothetical protein